MQHQLPDTSFPDQSRLNLKSLGMAMMLSVASVPAANAALNTAQIVASAVSQACISWRVSGICYWLFCGLHGCTVRTSVKVTHFIPEAVVSTYNSQGGNPWREMSMVSQVSGGLESSITGALSGVSAGGGNNELKTPGQRKTNLHFKYADAIGHPTCSEWWSAADTGLEARVVKQVDPGVMLRMSAALKMMGENNADYKEAVVRRLVSPDNLTVSQGGRAYAGYGGNADFTGSNTVTRMASLGGTALGSLAAFPAFDAMRQALPMVQAVLLMAVYIMVPLILAFAAYEYKTVITMTFVVFALNFLTFWWELARWLDSWVLEALYSSDSHSRWNVAGFQNSSDDLIMNLVMGTMFIVLPAVWLGALSWAGVSVGNALSSAHQQGTAKTESAGGKLGEAGANYVGNKAMK